MIRGTRVIVGKDAKDYTNLIDRLRSCLHL